MKHKHYDLILAWANGAEIQVRHVDNRGSWTDVGCPLWVSHCEYRIKPKPPVVRYLFAHKSEGLYWASPNSDEKNIKATFCPETGDLLTIEKI